MSLTMEQALGLMKLGLPDYPFGGVAFDPERRGENDAFASGLGIGDSNNGTRATDGSMTLALFAALGDPTGARSVLEDIAGDISLTEAPEEALTDLLADLMHYCHREGIEFYGHDGPLCTAQRHFAAESGGAAL